MYVVKLQNYFVIFRIATGLDGAALLLACIPEVNAVVTSVTTCISSGLKKIDSDERSNNINLLVKSRSQLDLLDIARCVAFKITKRYCDQIDCLGAKNTNSETKDEHNTCKTCWPCVKEYEKTPVERVAGFGAYFLLYAFATEDAMALGLQQGMDHELVIQKLVKIISRAAPSRKTRVLQKLNLDLNELLLKHPLPTKPATLSKQLISTPDSKAWILYDFYRKPAIRWIEENGQEIEYTESLPPWMDGTYGYRCGTRDELPSKDIPTKCQWTICRWLCPCRTSDENP